MTLYEMLKYWLLNMLEAYRDTPKNAPKRIFVDKIVEISRRSAENDSKDKQYHNLVVLQYLVDTPISVMQISKALHIGREKENYERITENAIDRLLILTFGTDGINWN